MLKTSSGKEEFIALQARLLASLQGAVGIVGFAVHWNVCSRSYAAEFIPFVEAVNFLILPNLILQI